jgi:hypothetical protein
MLESVVPSGYQMPVGAAVRIVIRVSAAPLGLATARSKPNVINIRRMFYISLDPERLS